MRAGVLNSLLTIQQNGTSVDELGQPIEGWTDVAQVWGNVRHLRGVEAIKAGAVTSTVSASIRIRYRPDLNAGMRVLADGRTYEIKAVLPDMQRREYVDLVCEVTQ